MLQCLYCWLRACFCPITFLQIYLSYRQYFLRITRNGLPKNVWSVQIRSYFWSVFSRIRTEYGPEITPYLNTIHASLRIQSECGKIMTRNNSVFGHFSRNVIIDSMREHCYFYMMAIKRLRRNFFNKTDLLQNKHLKLNMASRLDFLRAYLL